ncbi:MAG: methyltransferase [Mariprofundales bacterium]|nr:methyltransferase [Mariprofundales bacterium]
MATPIPGQVQSLLPGGESLVHTAQGSLLVGGCIAGEVVEVVPQQRHRGMQRGYLHAVKQPSSDRRVPPCPVADTCGGCALQHVTTTAQQTIKLHWVREAYHPIVHDDVVVDWLPRSPKSALRRRVCWHVATADTARNADGAVLLGFRQRRSHHLVAAGECVVVEPILRTLYQRLNAALRTGSLPLVETITATVLQDGIHLVLKSPPADNPTPPFDHLDDLPIQWWWQTDAMIAPWNRPVHRLHDTLPAAGGSEIAIGIGPVDFLQASHQANWALVQWLIGQCAHASRIVDLFCGSGNLSLPLAGANRQIMGADSNPDGINLANRSAKTLAISAQYRQVNLFDRFDPAPFTGADLLILDPPRKGARRVASMMGQLLPRQLIMIHCDPASGRRDAISVANQGYRLQRLHALEMFPESGHIETVSLWRK